MADNDFSLSAFLLHKSNIFCLTKYFCTFASNVDIYKFFGHR